MAGARSGDHTAHASADGCGETMWTVISAALGGLVLVLLVVLVVAVRRSRRRGEERVAAVVQSLEERMSELASELAGAVERAEEEGRRSRFLGEIAGSIDMDQVLERTLGAGARIEGV